MKTNKQKILIISLSVFLIAAIAALVLVCTRFGKDKDTDNGSQGKSEIQAADNNPSVSTPSTEESTTEEPTTEAPTEDPLVSRDKKYNDMAIKARENGQKVVYLTFDDGSSELTSQVLDTLDRYGVKATFFVVGNFSGSDENAKKNYNDIISRDNTLGLHSLTHDRSLIYSSLEEFKKDYNTMYDYMKELTGIAPYVSRFPGGSSTSYADEKMVTQFIPYVKEMGLVYYDWNVSSGDGAVISSDGVYQRVTEGVANNDVSVVLMHDGSGHEETVKALPRILDKLIEMNCVILPITQSTDPVQASL